MVVALLDGIDDVEGSLNELLERKVKAANKAKCGNEDEPPTERFGRCAKFCNMELTLGVGTSLDEDFCDPHGGGNAKDWSGNTRSGLIPRIQSRTYGFEASGHPSVGLDWIMGTSAESIVLDGVTTDLLIRLMTPRKSGMGFRKSRRRALV